MNDLDAATCSGMGSVNCSTGAASSSSAGSNFLIYWDADEARELLNDTSISKPGGGTLLTASGCASCNGNQGDPDAHRGPVGDWREEVVYRESTNAALPRLHNHDRHQAPYLHPHARSDLPSAGRV